MKRIVDIPDEVLESKHYCQYFGAWSTKLTELIEQSVPYNPSGDLISREALKEAITLYDKNVAEETWLQLYDSVLETIDNADAVDLWQMRQEATENALKKAREADGWISVKDKLPENHSSVVATDNNDVFVAWYDEGWKSSDSQFDKHTPIVAWRPIPQYTESVDV